MTRTFTWLTATLLSITLASCNNTTTAPPTHDDAGVTFTHVAAGGYHSLAMDDNGNAWVWGLNVGQLGNGDASDAPTPVLVAMPEGVTFTHVAAVGDHSLALDANGNAWAWGVNYDGQIGNGEVDQLQSTPVRVAMPEGVTFTQVAAGYSHSLALDEDGNAWAWGDNSDGQLGNGGTTDEATPVRVAMPEGVTFTHVAAGGYHSLALDANGNAWAWGDNYDGQIGNGNDDQKQPTPVLVAMPEGVTFTHVAAGLLHSLALDQDGNAWAWGDNSDGELGNGGTTDEATPVLVATPQGVAFTHVAAGGYHSLALDANGNAWAWGDSYDGQVGNGDATGYGDPNPEPVRVAMPQGVTFTHVAAGAYHSLALDADGNAWAWGNDEFRQLGDDATPSFIPSRIASSQEVTFSHVAAATAHSLALDEDGNGWAWGWDHYGQLGNGNDDRKQANPVRVAMPEGVTFTHVAAGWNRALALDEDGNAWAWGYNGDGVLGNGGTTDEVTPVRVAMPEGVTFTHVAAGFLHSLALDEDGNAWAWGDNGPLGSGGATDEATPVLVAMPEGVTFTHVAAGGYHSLALDEDGNAWAWGDNSDGKLGNGGTTDEATPVRVAMPEGVTFAHVAAGDDYSLALDANGNAWAWGDNDFGQLGNGGTTDEATPVLVAMPEGVTFAHVAAGDDYSLALDEDGSAWAWGGNPFGQLGNGATTGFDEPNPEPVRVAMPQGVTFTHVAAGDIHTLAIDGNGNAWAWGIRVGDHQPAPVRVLHEQAAR